jgi:hypothetical protein
MENCVDLIFKVKSYIFWIYLTHPVSLKCVMLIDIIIIK